MLSLLLFTADSDIKHGFQLHLMRNFFAHADFAFYRRISKQEPENNPCNNWIGITCYSDVVEIISFSFDNPGRLHLSKVPQTVRELTLNACQQSENLNCRYLPRDAQKINLSINKYTGYLELSALPRKLADINLMSNWLTGPIVLLDLPETLEKMNLMGNRIAQKNVYYGDLPSRLTGLYLSGNTLEKILPISADVKKADPSIFDERIVKELVEKAKEEN